MSISETISEKLGSFQAGEESEKSEATGLNTFNGVFQPSILSILGVILFLRLGVILGNIGIIPTLAIIAGSFFITFTTGLSISATATNMRVKGGGAYFMISRSFGIEIGSAIGITLYLAQVIGIAFYIEGFSESIRFIFPSWNPYLLESFSLIAITLLAYTSAKIALKFQFAILCLISCALISFFLGKSVEPEMITSPVSLNFWGAFALFFPAVTGIEVGFSMSGDLNNPRKSLPTGTLLAVAVGCAVYCIVAVLMWYRVPYEILRSNSMAILISSRVQSLILLGIWGATFSCAIGGILAAPRTLQALSNDGVLPRFLGKGFGATKEPRIATIVTFLIAFAFLFFGNINILAPILAMFFLTSYGMLNLATGLESLFGNPSWRPTFKTPSSISLLGAFLCLIAMLLINVVATLASIAIISFFYLIAKKKKLGKGWEDIRQGALLFFCRFAIYRLANLGHCTRSWRPYFLVFSSSPTQKTGIIQFADALTRGKGFLTVASIISTDNLQYEKIDHLEELTREFLQKKKVQCLVEIEKSNDVFEGMKKVITHYGLGPITPNTVILGFSSMTENAEKQAEIVRLADALGKNLVILKDSEAPKTGTIDIWWDEDNKNNNELMILLAHMLMETPRWKASSVAIKCLVPNEEGREQRLAYFQEFLSMSRLKVEVNVLVVPDEEEASAKTISKFSSDASIVFIGLEHPDEKSDNVAYGRYLKELMRSTSHLDCCAYVMGTEKIDLTNIFEYPV